MGTLFVGAHLEGAASSGRRLLEDEGDDAPPQSLNFRPIAALGLQVDGEVDERTELVSGEIGFLEKVSAEK